MCAAQLKTNSQSTFSSPRSFTWRSGPVCFSQPSFQGSPASGNLEGGANSSSSQQTIYSYSTGYDPASNVLGYQETAMTTNGPTSDQWSFAYDSLNRLAAATTTQAGNPYPNYCWSYDSFGNRTTQMSAGVPFASTQGGANACSTTGSLGQNLWAQYNGTTNGIGNNQMSATSQNLNQGQPGGYDQAGDVLNDGVNQYLYDAEGRICAEASTPVPGMTTMTGYVYDAEGNRVAKGTISSWSCDPSANGLTAAGNETDYILGPGGEQVTEMAQDANGAMNWQRSYVYAGGALIATYDPVPNPAYNPANPSAAPQTLVLPSFRLTDWLGTMRATTDAAGVWQGAAPACPSATARPARAASPTRTTSPAKNEMPNRGTTTSGLGTTRAARDGGCRLIGARRKSRCRTQSSMTRSR